MRKGELSERPKSLSKGSRGFVGEKERSGTKQLFRWGKLAPSMAVLPRASQLARREPSPCGLTKVQENGSGRDCTNVVRFYTARSLPFKAPRVCAV